MPRVVPLRDAYVRRLANKKVEVVKDVAVCCAGCPKEFGNMFDALAKMDYDVLSGACKQIMQRKNMVESSPLDWEPKGEFAAASMMVPNANMLHNGNRKRSRI